MNFVPASGQHGVDGRHAVSGRLHLHEEVGLHESGRGHEEGGVGDTTGRRDDLPSAAMNGLVRNHRIQDLELHIPDSWKVQ